MAATIAAIRKLNKRKVDGESDDTDNLLSNLTTRLPLKDTWDSELILGMLVLGSVESLRHIHFKFPNQSIS
jgi:hypothetical protein